MLPQPLAHKHTVKTLTYQGNSTVQGSLFVHTYKHKQMQIHILTPLTPVQKDWGQLLSYCVTLALAQGPAWFNSMTSPCVVPHVQ